MRILDVLVNALRGAAKYNAEAQVAPACILWPDPDRQWEAAMPRLRAEIPELLTLGDHDPGKRSGPAIWMRCAMARRLEEIAIPEGSTPVLYLPGVARATLRDVRACPDLLKPLAELQFRGVTWTQANRRDWTAMAFLGSKQGGVGLDLAGDAETRSALQLALVTLLDESVDLLRGRHLDAEFFHRMLAGDPTRSLLEWLDQGGAYRESVSPATWSGFVEICRAQLAFNPVTDGALKGAELLAQRQGPWLPVWDRFREAPRRYPNLPGLLRRVHYPLDLFADRSSWPEFNDVQEGALRSVLLSTRDLPPHEARARILEAEAEHGPRREWVWAELGESPLAKALEPLAVVAEVSSHGLAGGMPPDMAAAYRAGAWRADAAVVEALSGLRRAEDLEAVHAAVRATYLPWCDEAARHLQDCVRHHGYPRRARAPGGAAHPSGECLLFVDGLRFDVARALEDLLVAAGLRVEEALEWAPLPTVTATGKPAATALHHLIEGKESSVDFEPSVAASGQSLRGGHVLRRLLAEAGWQVLESVHGGNPSGKGWWEAGSVDHEGHDRGSLLARNLRALLEDIRDAIVDLLGSGWKSVRVVTDHGWLLMPGGLPKTELPASLSDNTWGRCAALKAGAVSDEALYPWYWNEDQHFALAPGVSCYRAGLEYAHGGLSLQECLLLHLTVTSGTASSAVAPVTLTDVAWTGMRCKVAADGEVEGLDLDLRIHAGDAGSSVAMGPKPFRKDGTSSVVVEDDDLVGTHATLVVTDASGTLVAQEPTIVGGGKR